MAPTKLSAFLALAAASPHCDAFSFTPSPRLQQRQTSVELSAQLDENSMVDGLKKVSGGAAAFLTGMGIMAQVAMADPSAMSAIDESTVLQTQSSTISSNVLLSIGAPSIGGGSSFDTMDFSMPDYDQTTSKGDATRSSPTPSASPSSSSSDDSGDAAAAKAAAKEDAKRAADEEKAEKAAQKQADADAKKKEAADAKEAAAKDEEAKVAAKEAKAKAKADRLAAEKEKQRIAVENQVQTNLDKSTSPTATADAIKDIKVPDIKVPEIKAPSFSLPKVDIDMPKIDIPKPAAPAVKIPDIPEFKAPNMDAVKMPDMKAFSLPKVDIPAMPKIDIPAPPKFDAPKFDTPSAAPAAANFDTQFDTPSAAAPAAAPKVDKYADLEPQEVRDERAAQKNSVYKSAQAEVKEAEKVADAAKKKAVAAKKVFKQAKGEACVSRPGGKALCLRGFGVGY